MSDPSGRRRVAAPPSLLVLGTGVLGFDRLHRSPGRGSERCCSPITPRMAGCSTPAVSAPASTAGLERLWPRLQPSATSAMPHDCAAAARRPARCVPDFEPSAQLSSTAGLRSLFPSDGLRSLCPRICRCLRTGNGKEIRHHTSTASERLYHPACPGGQTGPSRAPLRQTRDGRSFRAGLRINI